MLCSAATASGTGFTSAPTAGTVSNGTPTCTVPATVTSVLAVYPTVSGTYLNGLGAADLRTTSRIGWPTADSLLFRQRGWNVKCAHN